jgi:hypothetical protein
MGDPNTKVFTVTADVATAIGGGTRKRKRKATASPETMKVGKELQKAGSQVTTGQRGGSQVTTGQRGGTSPGTSLQIEANRAPGGAEPPPAAFKNSTATALAKVTTDSSPAPVQAGGTKPIKVILEKKKKQTKVVLAPTKVRKLNPAAPVSQAKTRKVAKKIRMSLNGFGKRVTRANTIRVDAKKQKIEDVKKTLVEAKLIKPESKAPEGVLRTMYADYMTLKNRAL